MTKEKKEKKEKKKKGAEEQTSTEGGVAAVGSAAVAAAALEKKNEKEKKKRKKKAEVSPRRLLSPLIPLYRLGLSLREFRLATGMEQVRWLRCPIISIGNLSTGGTGKTPFTIGLARALSRYNLPVDVLSRGYGRQSDEVLRVNPEGSAEEFGDEPLLIARETEVPVYVGAERYEAGILAESEALGALQEAVLQAAVTPGQESHDLVLLRYYRSMLKKLAKPPEAEPTGRGSRGSGNESAPPVEDNEPGPFCIHLLDDGFQHRQLARTVDILLLNEQDWEDRLLPAGNLREPLEALFRANVIAIPATEPELEDKLEAFGWQGPIWKLIRQVEVTKHEAPVIAFCGIARPGQFFEALEAAELMLADQFSFPDHYEFDESTVRELIASALRVKAKAVITTTKDLTRLGKLAELFPKNLPLEAARLRVEVEDRGAMLSWLAARLL